MSTQSILSKLLLALQFCLGFWQIGKLTPAGAIIQCVMGWLLLHLRLSKTYSQLKGFRGRVYKTVRCHVTTVADQPTVPRQMMRNEIKSCYLGKDFRLERRGINKLLLNGKMSYYITDTIWNSLLDIEEAAPKTVFLKGYKEFWQQVATGGVMTLSEVLDSLILDNKTIRILDNDLLLPVDLSVSEEKLLKFINLVGLFLQTNQQIYWLFPTLISFTAAVMEFATFFRVWLYRQINILFCFIMHAIGDRLPRSLRRQVYSLGMWVENLKPSNDIELRMVRGPICGVIAGGAKVQKEGAILVPWLAQAKDTAKFSCAEIDPGYPIELGCEFDPTNGKCKFYASTIALAEVECSRDEFPRLVTFIYCMAKNRSGSLKSCSSKNNEVHVRGFRESVFCYAKSRFPPVYELKLENAHVK